MRLDRLFALSLTIVFAVPAHAQVNLAWNNCLGVGNHAEVKQYACDGSLDGVYQYLVPTFVAPRTITFNSMVTILEFRSPSGTLPDYWKVWDTGCRPGVLTFTGVAGGIPSPVACAYPFAGLNAPPAWGFGIPGGSGPGFIQFEGGVTSSEVVLNAGTTYSSGVIRIDPVMGDCAGCEEDLCIRVVSIRLEHFGSPRELLTTPDQRSYVSWQGPAGICAGATPARKRTWGSVKSLYR